MDASSKYYAQWKKPDAKVHVLYDSTYVKCAEWANLCLGKVDYMVARDCEGMGNGERLLIGIRFLLG